MLFKKVVYTEYLSCYRNRVSNRNNQSLPLEYFSNRDFLAFQHSYQIILKTIERLKEILSSDENILQVIKNELLEIKEKYADERRTNIDMTAAFAAIANADRNDVEEPIISSNANGCAIFSVSGCNSPKSLDLSAAKANAATKRSDGTGLIK